jgi:pilus assembly protein FimV
MVHNSKIKSISLAFCIALMPFTAHALGMGKMTVLSGLGEPLNAEIELLAAAKDELSNVTARIATAQTYAEQGIDRPAALNLIRVELVSNPDASAKLKLTTQRPVDDPFLDMLIQVEWPTGQVLREYTALLDPPNYDQQKLSSGEVNQPVVLTDEPVEAKSSTPQVNGKKGKIRKFSAATETEPTKSVRGYSSPQTREIGSTETGVSYKVHSGDTLHGIAQNLQVEGVSLDQMLVGLYRGNKDAFSGENMNRLKVGKILKVPDVEKLQAVSKQEASREVRVQSANWNDYRNKLAGKVVELAPASDAAIDSRIATGKITGPAEDKAAQPITGPHDVVKLSKSDVGSTTSALQQSKATGLQEIAQQEDAIAHEKAIKEANERVAALEKQLQDMRKLLELKNQTAAEVVKGTSPQAFEPATEKHSHAKEPVESVRKPSLPPQKNAKGLRPVEQPEPGIVDFLMNNPQVPVGTGAVLIALLGGVWFYRRNKRKKGLDAFEQSILTTGGLKPNTVFGNTAGGVVDTSDMSFGTGFSHEVAAGMIDTSEVDPIAEAEVYMAYGRDVQAEEILRDAIVKEPTRYELHQKLLEIYAGRDDSRAFEALAGELYTTLGATDPLWLKVAEMGYKIEPGNPLYSRVGGHNTVQVSAPTENFSEAERPMAGEASLESKRTGDFSDEDGLLDLKLEVGQAASNVVLEEQKGIAEQQDLTRVMKSEPASTLNEVPALDLSLDMPELATSLGNGPEEAGLHSMNIGFELPVTTDQEIVSMSGIEVPADNSSTAMPELEDLISKKPETELTKDRVVGALESTGITFDYPTVDGDSGVQSLPGAEEFGLAKEVKEHSNSFEVPVDAVSNSGLGVFESVKDESHGKIIEGINNGFDVTQTKANQFEHDEGSQLTKPSIDFDLSGISLDFGESVPQLEPQSEAPPPKNEETFPQFEFVVGQGNEIMPEAELFTLGENTKESTSSAPQSSLGSAESESSDVETKLDLVAAYLDMGDAESARELLNEVLKEGGPQQRQRAQALIDSIA